MLFRRNDCMIELKQTAKRYRQAAVLKNITIMEESL